jgi:hypothetical protein
MRARLLFCLAGGSLGAAVALPLSSTLNMSPAIALIGCIALGAVMGCFVSVFIDVFIANHGD